ncbi:50S ribosomal protein L7/L12 [Brevibacterium casei S18]|uniref:50S ribosomal protein L7/L12 n=1 Tax=Brevibacterium casei S18 TaxID=1229781 RepID=K9AGS1_9MICO|nr:50S ribosomal protein L7/L12 [Brevibacterium casei S18]
MAFSASSFEAPSRTALGAPSTRSLASFSPREVSPRTSLMTGTFLSPADSRMTSNSVFSSAAASPPPAAGAATATAAGAAASTSNSSSNFLTKSESSMSVSSLKASMSSSAVSLAMVANPSCGGHLR